MLGLFLCPSSMFALDGPIKLMRACLDLSGNITVYFNTPADPCGSFSSYELWGRDNSINNFSKLTSSSTYNISQIAAALPNKKKWEFYVIGLFACNGSDTVFSDTIFMDDTPPALLDPDSVSVDLTTQRVIAGWPKAPESDVMGYSLFKTDQNTGNNILVDEKNVVFYSFPLTDFDPNSTWNRFSLAVYDSCKNGGVISNYHSPVYLGFNSGQNIDYQCTKKIYIQWNAYVGWSVDAYDIMVFDNISGAWTLVYTVPGSQLNYIFDIPALGHQYSFYVRAHKSASTITSSSNLIVFDAKDFSYPAYKQLGHVSVIADGNIEITGTWETTTSIQNTLLQFRVYGSSAWTTIATYPGAAGKIGRYIHGGRNTSQTKYQYRLLFHNSCNSPFDSSLIHTSLLLRRTLKTFYWNDYWAWFTGLYETDLYEKPKQSSTWNPELTLGDSEFVVIDTLQANCFKVASFKLGVNNKPIDTAYSNVICLRAIDTTLVPGAFSPEGKNPIFKIYNPNLLPGQAVMKIYNRWGERIFEGDALTGWDGKAKDGAFFMAGIYVYLIEIRTPEKIETFKGTIMMLR